ncbi:2-haloalkanoic acid dehalogenase [Myxococcus hansupus]|uniref:2-haloalkanoic acid dehalogenase n=1 Tax=Pseudomyxococcus hansupus TaxID=1297742 RepID=A0A0H4WUW8_9BACT|nr:HAD family hydrolase [Myxococcus hansupus]AKQ67216.1 2-haloalkanoic acid dehalogenase [Myxococcus hansupus]
MRPRAVFFDLDDTLIDRAGAFDRYVEDLFLRHPRAFPEPGRARALEVLRGLDGRGGIDRDVFCRDAVAAFPALPLSAEALWADMSSRLPAFARSDEDTRELVTALRLRAPVAVVSNGSGRVQRAKLAHADLTTQLPDVFLSGEVGASKPDPRIFQAALACVGRAPHEVLHVGDDPERDIQGAGRLGLSTCWVSHGRAWPAGLPPPTYTVERIVGRARDFAKVLSQWT